ncbi:Uncharacterized protein dnm_063090 [Desulfonema magnum]|uniref:Uncharacterized protein n=1 Tax=Desulfonema magnum TaxID=45655 RepID=A0A975BR98_9BACT|nr:Uncharacterized protein dnm_063090 [Desulfonema magnum]
MSGYLFRLPVFKASEKLPNCKFGTPDNHSIKLIADCF